MSRFDRTSPTLTSVCERKYFVDRLLPRIVDIARGLFVADQIDYLGVRDPPWRAGIKLPYRLRPQLAAVALNGLQIDIATADGPEPTAACFVFR